MKIYNKKGFVSGLLMIALGAVNLILDLAGHRVDAKGLILAAALFFFGLGAVLRSLSQKLTREDRLDQLDERNRLIELKTRSQSLRLTRALTFGLALVLLVLAKWSGEADLIAIAVGLGLAFGISLLAELFLSFYYDAKN